MAVTLELYLRDHVIRGELTVAAERRAVDLLNESNSNVVVLTDAWVGSAHVEAAPVKLGQIRVQRSEILFVIPHDTVQRGPRQLRSAFVEKRPLRTVVGLGPFAVTGTIHVGQYETAADSLAQTSTGRGFLPITGVTVTSQHDPRVSLEAGIVLVNRAAITYTAMLADAAAT